MANYTNLSDLFGAIADKIRIKTNTTNTIIADNFPSSIDSIVTLSEGSSDATATAENILKDQTAYVNGEKVIGTMANNEATTTLLNCDGSYTIPKGFHDGTGVVTANNLANQTQATATSENIESGYTAWVNGAQITGTKVASEGKKLLFIPEAIPTSNGAGTLTVSLDPSITINKIYAINVFCHEAWVYTSQLATNSIIVLDQTWENGQEPNTSSGYSISNCIYHTGSTTNQIWLRFGGLTWSQSGTNLTLTPHYNPNENLYFGYVTYNDITYGYSITIVYD